MEERAILHVIVASIAMGIGIWVFHNARRGSYVLFPPPERNIGFRLLVEPFIGEPPYRESTVRTYYLVAGLMLILFAVSLIWVTLLW